MPLQLREPEKLWRRYVLAMVLVVGLLSASHLASRSTLSGSVEEASVLNLSGRQRMLSQRILFFGSEPVDDRADRDSERRLNDAIDLFERSQLALARGGAFGLSEDGAEERRRIYARPLAEGRSTSDLVAAFVEDARVVAAGSADAQTAFARMRSVGPSQLLEGLDQAVSAFEQKAAVRAARLDRLSDATFLAALLVLGLEALLIFLPAQRTVDRSLSALRRSNADLSASKAEAEKALAVRKSFLANMSHEIRTPMNGVLGMAEVLGMGDLDDDQRQAARIIQSSGAALMTILNDVLDLSKLEAGKMALNEAPFDLRRTAEEVAALMAASVTDKNLTLSLRYHESLPSRFVGDEGRLRQVLSNLVGNAVKFTPSGGVSISIDGAQDHDSCALTIRVEDTGIGIHPDDLPRMFEEFEQADETGRRVQGGTGLGLSICSDLVALMGGTIHARSAPRQGTIFTVSVSLILAEVCSRKQETAPLVDLPRSTNRKVNATV